MVFGGLGGGLHVVSVGRVHVEEVIDIENLMTRLAGLPRARSAEERRVA